MNYRRYKDFFEDEYGETVNEAMDRLNAKDWVSKLLGDVPEDIVINIFPDNIQKMLKDANNDGTYITLGHYSNNMIGDGTTNSYWLFDYDIVFFGKELKVNNDELLNNTRLNYVKLMLEMAEKKGCIEAYAKDLGIFSEAQIAIGQDDRERESDHILTESEDAYTYSKLKKEIYDRYKKGYGIFEEIKQLADNALEMCENDECESDCSNNDESVLGDE